MRAARRIAPLVRAAVLLQLLPRLSRAAPGAAHAVRASSSRFDQPWRAPPRVHMPSLAESRHRVLYSPVRVAVSDGLGHGLATMNADVSTAIRLGVTYTHRVAKYGSLVPAPALLASLSERETREHVAGLSAEAGAVEGFFAWGVGEVPREAVQEAVCPDVDKRVLACKLCPLGRVKNGSANAMLKLTQVVEVPEELSYRWVYRATAAVNRTLDAFLRKHSQPGTVFQMPKVRCDKSPAYSKFSPESRSFFFHKYWDAHQARPRRGPHHPAAMRLYRSSWVGTLRIPGVPPRAKLVRLREHELTIAVHARRGDFFRAGRPMVSIAAFARVVRKVVHEVRRQNGTFARMPVAINVYSEGLPKKGLNHKVGHDVTRLTREFRDPDGRVLDVAAVTREFREAGRDKFGNVYANGLKVALRVSEDTLLCLHEMIAADVFVGSASGMSQHLVGSLSRGAMQILPKRYERPHEWHGHVEFDQTTGELAPEELVLMSNYWREFEKANAGSAQRALETFRRSKQL